MPADQTTDRAAIREAYSLACRAYHLACKAVEEAEDRRDAALRECNRLSEEMLADA